MENLITKNIKDFVPNSQIEVIKQGLKGEEKSYFEDMLTSLDKTIETMPKTYETDGIKLRDKTAHLHYFSPGSDWYIVEKDSEPEQLQAFGYAVLNGDLQNAELGYINIEELKKIKSVEADLHWAPKTIGEILKEKNPNRSKIENVYNDAIKYKDLKACVLSETDDEGLYLFEGKQFINKESGYDEKWEITSFFKYGIIVEHITKNKLSDTKKPRKITFDELRELYKEKYIEIYGINDLQTLNQSLKILEKCIDNIDLKEEVEKEKGELSEIKSKIDKEKQNEEIANNLMGIDSDIWNKLKISSGSQLYSDLELQEKYKEAFDKKIKELNLSYPLDMQVHDIIEDENFHSLNQYLRLSNAYGEKQRDEWVKFLEKIEPGSKENPLNIHKESFLNLHIFYPGPKGEKLSKEALAVRLKILKKMDQKNPSSVLKTRIKLIEKMLSNPEKYCSGGSIGMQDAGGRIQDKREKIAKLDERKNKLLAEGNRLSDIKEKLFGKIDISEPVSKEEKELAEKISKIYSEINEIINEKRKLDKMDGGGKIAGGLAEGMTIEDIAKKHGVSNKYANKQWHEGKEVELEHSNDPSIASEIALDHLFEDIDYYIKLEKIEKNEGGITGEPDPYTVALNTLNEMAGVKETSAKNTLK